MWLVTAASTVEFDALARALGHGQDHVLTTPTGARLAAQPGTMLPTVGLVSDDAAANRRLVEYVHANLHPQGIVTSGLALRCAPPPESSGSDAYLLPTRCYRAVGRIEPGGGPMLYEELAFHLDLQAQLASLIRSDESLDRRPLFAAPRTLQAVEIREWIGAQLSCPATDGHTGGLHVLARNMGLPIASLKIVASPTAIEALERVWSRLEVA